MKNIESFIGAYYLNDLIDFNQILHNDRDDKVAYSSWVVRIRAATNPRRRTAAILKKTVNWPYHRNRLTDFGEMW